MSYLYLTYNCNHTLKFSKNILIYFRFQQGNKIGAIIIPTPDECPQNVMDAYEDLILSDAVTVIGYAYYWTLHAAANNSKTSRGSTVDIGDVDINLQKFLGGFFSGLSTSAATTNVTIDQLEEVVGKSVRVSERLQTILDKAFESEEMTGGLVHELFESLDDLVLQLMGHKGLADGLIELFLGKRLEDVKSGAPSSARGLLGDLLQFIMDLMVIERNQLNDKAVYTEDVLEAFLCGFTEGLIGGVTGYVRDKGLVGRLVEGFLNLLHLNGDKLKILLHNVELFLRDLANQINFFASQIGVSLHLGDYLACPPSSENYSVVLQIRDVVEALLHDVHLTDSLKAQLKFLLAGTNNNDSPIYKLLIGIPALPQIQQRSY